MTAKLRIDLGDGEAHLSLYPSPTEVIVLADMNGNELEMTAEVAKWLGAYLCFALQEPPPYGGT